MNAIADQKKPLLKFKMEWDETVTEHDGFDEEIDRYQTTRSVIIFAENEDAAFDKWEKDFENENNNGCDSCTLVIEHPLLEQRISFDMFNGDTYLLPIQKVLEHHAQKNSVDHNHDENLTMATVTLPYFEQNPAALNEYVKSLDWEWIAKHSIVHSKKYDPTDLALFFREKSQLEVEDPAYNKNTLRNMSCTVIVYLFQKAFAEQPFNPESKALADEALRLMQAGLPVLIALRDSNLRDIQPNMSHFSLYDLKGYAFEDIQRNYHEAPESLAHEQELFKCYMTDTYQVSTAEEYEKISVHLVSLEAMISLAAHYLIGQQQAK